MNLRDSRKNVDWMLEDCMEVYGMNPDEYRNCCKNCVNRDLEYRSDTCEICTMINKKVNKFSICDFYVRERINK